MGGPGPPKEPNDSGLFLVFAQPFSRWFLLWRFSKVSCFEGFGASKTLKIRKLGGYVLHVVGFSSLEKPAGGGFGGCKSP